MATLQKSGQKRGGLFVNLVNRSLKTMGYEIKERDNSGNASPGGSFPSAGFGRLMADWMSNGLSADRTLDGNLKTMRDRSRQLDRSSDYMRRFYAELISNVLGSSGIQLKLKIKDPVTKKIDTGASAMIEDSWAEFGKKGIYDVTGELSDWKAQVLGLRSFARDGEFLCRKIKGWDNKFKFAFQFWESDLLDHKYNAELPNGNKVRLGVERDSWGRRVAYYIFSEHPGDYYWGGNRVRIPADQIIHVMQQERFGQSRGFPWGQSAFRKLHMLDQYEETELVSSRVEAGKMGFYIPKVGQDWDGEVDTEGDLISEVEPGTFEQLPQGMDFKEYDPQHPNKCFADFRKAMLRSIASGLLTSYNFLASDLEGVNYTSLRAGAMNEREMWKIIQVYYALEFLNPQYSAWLEMAIMSGALKLPMAKYDKFNNPAWAYRRWGWVDPLKEVQASVLAINERLTSRSAVYEESGDADGSYEDLVTEIAADEDLLKKEKVPPLSAKPLPGKPSPDNPEGEGPQQ